MAPDRLTVRDHLKRAARALLFALAVVAIVGFLEYKADQRENAAALRAESLCYTQVGVARLAEAQLGDSPLVAILRQGAVNCIRDTGIPVRVPPSWPRIRNGG